MVQKSIEKNQLVLAPDEFKLYISLKKLQIISLWCKNAIFFGFKIKISFLTHSDLYFLLLFSNKLFLN